jgi:hypothetical protein
MVEVSEKFNLHPNVCNATLLLIAAKISAAYKISRNQNCFLNNALLKQLGVFKIVAAQYRVANLF